MAGDEGIQVAPKAPRSLLLTLVGGVALAGLAAALILTGIEDAAREGGQARPGEPAPAFEMERFGGGMVSLEELRGKVVMLDFWATWCPPCVKEMPWLVRIARDYESRGLVFLAASRDDPPETAKADVGIFMARREPGLKPFVTFAGDEVASRYGVEVLPTLFFIDREGRVVDVFRGAVSEKKLRARLDEILAEPN